MHERGGVEGLSTVCQCATCSNKVCSHRLTINWFVFFWVGSFQNEYYIFSYSYLWTTKGYLPASLYAHLNGFCVYKNRVHNCLWRGGAVVACRVRGSWGRKKKKAMIIVKLLSSLVGVHLASCALPKSSLPVVDCRELGRFFQQRPV